MDCCVCGSGYMFRPPRNTICATCFEGAKSLLTVLNSSEINAAGLDSSDSRPLKPNSNKTLMNVWKNVTAMRESVEELKENIQFLSGLACAFKDQIHTDILLKPNNTDPPIPAHKALMAARSKIFKYMLDSDTCKAAMSEKECVTLPEMSGGELESLLEFFYAGSLPEEKMRRHVYALSAAADKYDVPYLGRICERHMATSLSVTTALDVLKVSELCSLAALQDTALNFIAKNMKEIAFSPEFDDYALKNPHLCVLITRASFKDSVRSSRYGGEEELIDHGYSTTTTMV